MIKLSSRQIIFLLRISIGLIFLWTFLDKTFGLGFSTLPTKSWILGNSPTAGFLANATEGPFESVFSQMSGNMVVDWLFMLGMGATGLALILGMGMKVATISGILMMGLIYLSQFPPQNNPLIDEHIIYMLLLFLLYKSNAGDERGLGKWWKKQKIVKKYPWLG